VKKGETIMDFLNNEFVATIIYAILALVLMFVGYKVFDMITPYNFAEEIKEKNPAVGAVIAGIFIAVAIIIKAAIA
jgi:uncharacterized membrane protein YjfL (UPF0719 family)